MATGQWARLKTRARPLTDFWGKLNEDWVFNLSGMLAYNYLTATAPLALVVVAIAGIALGSVSPQTFDAYVQGLTSHLPAGGEQLVVGALKALSASAGVLLVIAIVTAIFAGSRLFIALENCFAIIYRLRTRTLVPQNLVAIGMTLLYTILAPLAFLVSGQLTGEISGLFSFITVTGGASRGILSYLEGLVAGIFVAFILFYAMYLIVPSRRHSWRRGLPVAWRGALVAAVLLNLYEQLFPLYQSLFLQNTGYGSVVGLAIIAVIFLYYTGFITLLGAEINAWSEGLRPLSVTLPDLYRERGKMEEAEEAMKTQ